MYWLTDSDGGLIENAYRNNLAGGGNREGAALRKDLQSRHQYVKHSRNSRMGKSGHNRMKRRTVKVAIAKLRAIL